MQRVKPVPLVFDEWYGHISRPERAAIKKYNVSPMDHEMLCDEFGRDNHAVITRMIKERSPHGYYREPVR